MPAALGRRMGRSQSGRIELFSIIIIIMLFICAYELSIIYSDWKLIKKMPLKINIVNDRHAPIADVSVTLNDSFIGQTNEKGEITTLIPEPGKFHITATKKPFQDIDTTVTINDSRLNAVFAMPRPYSSLMLLVLEGSGKPLSDVNIILNDKDYGKTGSDGTVIIRDAFRLDDNIQVKLTKAGFNDLVAGTDLSELTQTESFTMTSEPVAKPKTEKPAAPMPDFQSHFDLANKYLDKAISGEPKYFGISLREIDQAIEARPQYLPAKQLKVEILYNFAKSLRDSKLLHEAANRCGEALKIYGQIPQDQMYVEIQKLKGEIDKSLK